MKRLFYVALIAISCSLPFTGCTEEEIVPEVENSNHGGGVQDEIKR